MAYTVGSLFSGIGGLDLAAHWAGFETAWFVEREPFCQKVLAKHWPNTPIHSDVFDCHNLPHVDVIVGGFPCQPFSVAGKRQGAKDERYLLPEMLRIISEVQPYAVLFENVPGFPSLNDGAEFKQLLRALAEMGFDAEWGHLRASDAGAPHQRERWFCVAYANGFSGGTFGTSGLERRSAATLAASGEPSGMAYATGAGTGRYTRRVSETGGEIRDAFSGRAGISNSREAVGNPQRGGFRRFTRRWAGAQLANGHSQPEEDLGNASSQRCTECNALACERETGFDTWRPDTQWGDGQPQPGLGGAAYGVPARMDFPGWPARPNEPQYPYEPPRVNKGASDRAKRLKALGNAAIPQVVYPLMLAIYEWLESLS